MTAPVWAEGTPKPKPRPDAAAMQAGQGSPAGAYLAAKDALAQGDYAAAVGWFAQALALDPANPALLDGAVTVRLAVGDVTGAAQAARGRRLIMHWQADLCQSIRTWGIPIVWQPPRLADSLPAAKTARYSPWQLCHRLRF